MATAKKARAARPAKKAGATRAAAKSPGTRKAQAPAATVTRPALPASAPKPDKSKRAKLVRDSFTIPKAEYAVLQDLKQRAAKLGRPAKKSEMLRAGIKALAAMGDSALVAALATVPAIKTGRPSQA
jgi:hypothetical protein